MSTSTFSGRTCAVSPGVVVESSCFGGSFGFSTTRGATCTSLTSVVWAKVGKARKNTMSVHRKPLNLKALDRVKAGSLVMRKRTEEANFRAPLRASHRARLKTRALGDD